MTVYAAPGRLLSSRKQSVAYAKRPDIGSTSPVYGRLGQGSAQRASLVKGVDVPRTRCEDREQGYGREINVAV
jgi:hypothetical protein